MVNRSKQRGTAFESRVVSYLREHGFPEAMRRPLAGVNDLGDVANVPGVVIECKAHKAIDLAGFVDEMVREKANAGAPLGVVIVPRRSHTIDRAYVIQELGQWVKTIL